jgi:hypothetical protein
MHTFVNSRSMAQLVARDLMAEEARLSEVRRDRRALRRRTRSAGSSAARAGDLGTRSRPRWWIARALRLVH